MLEANIDLAVNKLYDIKRFCMETTRTLEKAKDVKTYTADTASLRTEIIGKMNFASLTTLVDELKTIVQAKDVLPDPNGKVL
jgi:hypothetical protein